VSPARTSPCLPLSLAPPFVNRRPGLPSTHTMRHDASSVQPSPHGNPLGSGLPCEFRTFMDGVTYSRHIATISIAPRRNFYGFGIPRTFPAPLLPTFFRSQSSGSLSQFSFSSKVLFYKPRSPRSFLRVGVFRPNLPPPPTNSLNLPVRLERIFYSISLSPPTAPLTVVLLLLEFAGGQFSHLSSNSLRQSTVFFSHASRLPALH